ncbi:MAG: ROK family protein [Eubacteriales bacterium]|nr:ROK family protein [Eubacteriales bacterium]
MKKSYAAGLDIGGTSTKIGLVDPNAGIVTDHCVFPTEKHNEENFYRSLSRHMTELKRRNGYTAADVAGIGISVGSFLYHPEGTIDGMSSMVDFLTPGYPLKDRVAAALDLPAVIDNDARLIGQAEALYGAGRGFCSVLTLTMGTGIGIALTTDGKAPGPEARMHLGGHIRVRETGEAPVLDGRTCYCHTPGCLESTCAAPALEAFARDALGKSVTCPEVFVAAKKKEPAAESVVRWYLTMLIRGLNQYIYLYGPDVIVLAGGLSEGFQPFARTLRMGLNASIAAKRTTELRLAQLGETAGILGAARLLSDTL